MVGRRGGNVGFFRKPYEMVGRLIRGTAYVMVPEARGKKDNVFDKIELLNLYDIPLNRNSKKNNHKLLAQKIKCLFRFQPMGCFSFDSVFTYFTNRFAAKQYFPLSILYAH